MLFTLVTLLVIGQRVVRRKCGPQKGIGREKAKKESRRSPLRRFGGLPWSEFLRLLRFFAAIPTSWCRHFVHADRRTRRAEAMPVDRHDCIRTRSARHAPFAKPRREPQMIRKTNRKPFCSLRRTGIDAGSPCSPCPPRLSSFSFTTECTEEMGL